MSDLLERIRAVLADRYAVESEIGRGGMAIVFLAEDLKHDRKVAIKVLHPELSVTLATERFLSEIKIAAGLNHPHILALFDSGEVDGLLYYVMPYVAGESLRHRLEREGQLPVEESVRIAVEVADGLQQAHEQGVIHRDVKPGNILLSGKHAVITDFGIARAITVAQGARVTSTGLGVGTPLYASPEQVMGAETLDGRTDVYSLGCVLYEMLAGQVPLAASTPHAVQARRLTETPGPIHPMRDTVPPLLDQVIAKALARLPADRWESAEKFGQALLTATVDATPVARLDLATTPGLEAIAAEHPGRRPVLWAIGAVVLTGATIGTWLVAPRAASLTEGGEHAAAPAVDVGPTETKIPLEGRLGGQLDTGHGPFADSPGPFAVSPDGEQLAYCSYDTEAEAGRLRLANLSHPERAHRLIAASDDDCIWIRWAPRGDRVFFVATIHGRMESYEVPTVSGLPRPFTDCPSEVGADSRWAALSPDESLTVFGTEQGFLRVVPTGSCDFAEGDSVDVGKQVLNPQWSPDSERILLTIGDTLLLLRTDGSDRQIVHIGGAHGRPVWPVSASGIYYQSGGGRVVRIPVSASGKPRGGPEPVAGSFEDPIYLFSLSADARRMVFPRTSHRFRLVRIVPEAREDPSRVSIVPVTETLEGYGAFRVSHDGEWVAHVQVVGGKSDLFKSPILGGTAVRLTRSGQFSNGAWPAWSPDDDLLAYSGLEGELWFVSADGTSTGRVLETRTAHPFPPGLSWESKGLLYERHDQRAGMLTDLDIEYGQWQGPDWVPAPPGSAPGATFVARGSRHLLVDTLVADFSYFPIASPDGSRALVIALLEGIGEYWSLVSIADSIVTPLVPPFRGEGYPISWSEDGRYLYWLRGNALSRRDLDLDELETLVTLPTLPESQKWSEPIPNHLGTPCQPRSGTDPLEFVCAIDESVTELFLVENFDP